MSFLFEISSSKRLTEEDFDQIFQEICKELTEKLASLNERVVVPTARFEQESDNLGRKFFNLQFLVVSPLYYRLQRHLIDWGNRSEHPHLDKLHLTKFCDKRGLHYYNKLLTIPGDKA